MTQQIQTISSWRLADELHGLATRLLRHARQADLITEIAPAQLSALSALVFHGPMTLGQLAIREQISAPSISRTIDTLERRTLVRRARDKRDRRVVYAVATREGRQLLQMAREKRLQRLQQSLSSLSAPQRNAIEQALRVIEQCLNGSSV